MATAAKLKIFLAGRVALESDDVVLDEARFPGRQGRLLFAYLVAEKGRPVPRDELADALWGEAPPATSDKALAVLASKLRGLLADRGIDGGKALTSAFGSYRLDLPEWTWVDILAAADALREAEAALAADDFDPAKAAAMEAASLARPSFLPGEEGAWVDGKRRELTDIRRRALSCLAEASLRLGDTAEAAKWAEETIALDPYRETGYRQLMAAHAAAGNRAEALRVYEQCRQLLATELGAYPSPETESIYRELLEAPSPQSGAVAPEATPVAVVERASPHAESPAPVAVPRHLWRRRRILVGAVAGMIAAVAIPLLALGGGNDGAELDDATNNIGVLDARSGNVQAAVELEAAPTAVAAGHGYVWAASADSDAVFAIDPDSNEQHDRIEVGNAPGGIAVGNGYVWVTNSADGTVSQIDPKTTTLLPTITVGNGPTGIAVRNGHVWVANTSDHTVSKIRASDGKLLTSYAAGPDPAAVAVGRGAVWVASRSSDTVLKLNADNGRVLDKISVGQVPAALAVGLGSVWVANSEDGTVTQIDAASGIEIRRIRVGEGPVGIAIVRGEVWTANEEGTISRVDPARGLPTTVSVGNRPSALAAMNGSVYVALRPTGVAHRGGTLTVALPSFEPLPTLDLAVASCCNSLSRFAELTNDGLLTYRHVGGQAGNQLVADLADKMPYVSPDRKTYTFHLRPNIRYSNGQPVRASDFRYAIERAFMLRRRTDPSMDYLRPADFFFPIRGTRHCSKRRCNLAAGIETDNVKGTVSFHFSTQDPYFLYKLASSFAAPVPAGTSLRERTRRPLPATGPYRIATVTDRSLRLVRNPHFRVWSETAQPEGFPDEIVLKAVSSERGISLVKHEKADLTSNLPLRRFAVEPKLSPRRYVHPLPATVYLVLDPHRTPFNDARARRALNYAVDRNKVAQLASEAEGSKKRPTCQLLPPNFPGYRPHCPYANDQSADAAWTAPDLSKAAQLVEASGTRGARVSLWVDRDFASPAIGSYLKLLLKKLGYRPQLRESFEGTPRNYFTQLEQGVMTQQKGPRIAFAAWAPDYPAASSFIQELLSCESKFNYGRLCDQEFERSINRAMQLEPIDQHGANRLWAQLDREITEKALLVPLFNGYVADLVSKRVGNYQYSPWFGPLLSQMWVR